MGRERTQNRLRRALVLALRLLLILGLPAFAPAQAADPTTSYFEFGKVVALGKGTVEVESYDAHTHQFSKHVYTFAKETRAEIVHLNDFVEVIYVPSGGGRALRRLLVLNDGIPAAGPPAVAHASSAGGGPGAGLGAAPRPSAVSFSSQAAPAPASSGTPVTLGGVSQPKAASIVSVPLGEAEAIARVRAPGKKAIAHDAPSEECNRSSADWPREPVRLAVLDFRYPTEREEAHDQGTTGGGSGTAVADLVFERLEGLPDFALSRGDRNRLYRGDFAGAARIGRQLGADAVLAGTFEPVGVVEEGALPTAYELRAGIVDTCTGQLLMRLSSAGCPGGLDPGPTGSSAGGTCTRYSVTPTQAADPQAAGRSYKAALDALVKPLENNGPPPHVEGTAGVVSQVEGRRVTIRLHAGAHLQPGDQVGVHAWGLSKDPSTYTLRNLHDEEIGRVTIASVQGGTATGEYAGDIPPRSGETADLIQP